MYQRIPFSAKLKYAIINRMTLPQTKLRIKSVRIMVNGTILIDCKILMPQTLLSKVILIKHLISNATWKLGYFLLQTIY